MRAKKGAVFAVVECSLSCTAGLVRAANVFGVTTAKAPSSGAMRRTDGTGEGSGSSVGSRKAIALGN